MGFIYKNAKIKYLLFFMFSDFLCFGVFFYENNKLIKKNNN